MDLDADWIDKFNQEEKRYEPFYLKKVHDVRIVFLYINSKNELIYSKKFKSPIENAIISKNKLIKLLKDNILYNNRKFFPSYMFKFNITLEPQDIKAFLIKPHTFNFFTQANYMKPIKWEDTIEFFHPLNCLYIFMKNRSSNLRGSTKKIYITNKKRKKTRRKYI